jgi:hypothetical protein
VAGLTFSDDDGVEVVLDEDEASTLLAVTSGLDEATVSACPDCRSKVLAVVAFVDMLDAAPPHPRTSDLLDLANEAPTLHLYVIDGSGDTADTCEHRDWLDPGHEEWSEAVVPSGSVSRHP